MIRLSYSLLDNPIEFKENIVNVLVLESPRSLRTFSQNLRFEIENEDSQIILSKDYDDIKFDKYADVIFSVMDVDLNNKKILNKIYGNLKELAFDEDRYIDTTNFLNTTYEYLNKLILCSDCTLCYDDFDIEVFFKSVGIKIEIEDTSLLKKICNYIDIMSEFFNIHIFIFFHLKEYLEPDELLELYKHCNYSKQNLLLCENTLKPTLDYEEITLIDEDLCQIY